MTLRPTSRLLAPAVVALAFVAVSLGIIGCFSERSNATATLATTTCNAPSTTAGATVVYIRSFTFEPPTIHVKSGGSVAWVNCEPTAIPHTSTADGGAWTSGSLAREAAFVRAFPSTGTFAYHCAIHPSMKATVIVE